MITTTSEAFKAVFANKNFTFKMIVSNSEGDVVVFKKNALRYLEIVDNIFNPFHCGEIIITNDSNVLENSNTPMVFLGDGRDMLFLDIQPEDSSDRFKISLQCVITECSEMVYQKSLCKRLSFVEYGQYAINEKFCNVLSLNQGSSYLQTNAAAAQTTGDLIKKLINDTFDNAADDLSLFDTDAATGQPAFDNEGSGSIRVSPYGSMSCKELLSYALQMHTHQGSPCILQHDRTTKKFQLVSLKRLFESNSRYASEMLGFADSRQVDTSTPSLDISNTPTVANIAFDYYPINFDTDSQIAEFYTEAPAAKFGVDHFANESISSYSKNSSTFSYNLKSLSKENFIKTYTDLFVKPFESLFSKYKLQPNFYVTTDNQKKRWLDSSSTLPPALTENQFINQKMVSLLYLNYTYVFKLPGITSRQSRTFVDVYKRSLPRGQSPSKWDCNTLGRHFVTCVKHVFTQDNYHNHIETVKPYRLSSPETSQISIDNYLK